MKKRKIHLVSADSKNENGLEYFISKAFKTIDYEVIETDYRIMSKELVDTRIKYITDCDFLLCIKSERINPESIFSCRIPKILYMQDSVQANQEANFVIQTKSSLFDIVFSFDDAELSFYKQFNKNSFFLPLAADPDIHKFIDNKNKLIDVGFVGSLNNNRVNMINYLLSRGIPVQYSYSIDKYAEIVSNTKININIGIIDSGYQQRIFEILSMGGFLFTNKLQNSTDLFKNKEHLIYYENLEHLVNLCYDFIDENYLINEISMNGRKEVIEKHTYVHRVKTIIEKVKEML